jgi:hypothetical protein
MIFFINGILTTADEWSLHRTAVARIVETIVLLYLYSFEDSSLLKCDIISVGQYLPAFHRSLPPSGRSKNPKRLESLSAPL